MFSNQTLLNHHKCTLIETPIGQSSESEEESNLLLKQHLDASMKNLARSTTKFSLNVEPSALSNSLYLDEISQSKYPIVKLKKNIGFQDETTWSASSKINPINALLNPQKCTLQNKLKIQANFKLKLI